LPPPNWVSSRNNAPTCSDFRSVSGIRSAAGSLGRGSDRCWRRSAAIAVIKRPFVAQNLGQVRRKIGFLDSPAHPGAAGTHRRGLEASETPVTTANVGLCIVTDARMGIFQVIAQHRERGRHGRSSGTSAPGSMRRRRGELDGWTPLVPTLTDLHRRACPVKGSQTAAGGAESRTARRASMASVLDGA
jgi:hypothetical protein